MSVILAVVGFVIFLLWIWMLIDCATKEPSGTNKVVWILVILFANGLGALIYFLVRRPERIQAHGA